MKISALRLMLGTIGIVQLILGIVFLLVPTQFAALLGLAVVPAWALWMFTMFSARAFGFAYGMFVAVRQPEVHGTWIVAMIAVQAVDWLGTMYYLLRGELSLPQVSTAAFLPVIFIIVVLSRLPRLKTTVA